MKSKFDLTWNGPRQPPDQDGAVEAAEMDRVENLVRPRRDTATHPLAPLRQADPDPLRSSPSTLQGLPSRPTRADGSLPLTTGEPSWE